MQAIIHMRLLGALLFLSVAAAASKNFVTLVSSPVLAQYGQPTILPCWLDPPQRAEALEIRWYQDENYDAPIILYNSKKLSVEGDTDRVMFGEKDSNSKGLATGDVSLRFSNITIKDEGNYTCYVSSDQGYDRGSVSLRVTKTGSKPVLSVQWLGENQANVSCESDSWYPQPRLRWLDHKERTKELAPRSLLHSSTSAGSVSVHSWLLVSGFSRVSCSVGVSGESVKEAIIHLQGNLPVDEGLGSLSVGLLTFCVLLLLVLAIIAVVFLRKRVCRRIKHKTEESEQILSSTEMEKLLTNRETQPCYENITLEATDNLVVKDVEDGVIVRDKSGVQFPDGTEVTFCTAIKGKHGFSEGKHYWEVSLQRPNLDVKKSWWIGLTNAEEQNTFRRLFLQNVHKCRRTEHIL
uniref:Ig-like domain-containing protein n=1 Tax=Cynoglossus semilaevis TaxID=244447 RepID=A0A3P8ULX6_CYNSE